MGTYGKTTTGFTSFLWYSYLGALSKPEFSALVRFLKDLGGFRLLFATFFKGNFHRNRRFIRFLKAFPRKAYYRFLMFEFLNAPN